MDELFLVRTVYPCFTDDGLVLLDLDRDKYFGIDTKTEVALGHLLHGWPVRPRRSIDVESDQPLDLSVLADTLVEKGILTRDRRQGKTPTLLDALTAETSLLDADTEYRAKVGATDLGNFTLACLQAALSLRFRSLKRIVVDVEGRRRMRRVDARLEESEGARNLVQTFFHLRPLLFTSRDRCLFDSLSLLNFLARYQIFPSWIFGVRTGPFSAHCWIQHGSQVFNDDKEHVRRFVPIMKV